MTHDSRPLLAPNIRLQNDRVTGEPLLLSQENILTLNPTSHEIVSRCDGTRCIREIVNELSLEYEAPFESLCEDVIGFLTEIHSKNMIVFVP